MSLTYSRKTLHFHGITTFMTSNGARELELEYYDNDHFDVKTRLKTSYFAQSL